MGNEPERDIKLERMTEEVIEMIFDCLIEDKIVPKMKTLEKGSQEAKDYYCSVVHAFGYLVGMLERSAISQMGPDRGKIVWRLFRTGLLRADPDAKLEVH